MPIAETKSLDDAEREFVRLNESVRLEIVGATAGLFYLLKGIEDMGERGIRPAPIVRDLIIFPLADVTPESTDFSHSGTMCQLAFRGWLDKVLHGIWEPYRIKIKDVVKKFGIDEMPPELEFMNSFRRVRNDLTHNRGKASRDYKWFKKEEPIILNLDFVVEFLYEMGAIGKPFWLSKFTSQEEIDSYNSPSVQLISFRKHIVNEEGGKEETQLVSCIFEDGMFGIGSLPKGINRSDFLGGKLDERGDIVFSDELKLRARNLYDSCKSSFLSEGYGNLPWMPGPEFIVRKEE